MSVCLRTDGIRKVLHHDGIKDGSRDHPQALLKPIPGDGEAGGTGDGDQG